MSEENKQITLSFGGFDDNNDNTLMFNGPLYVAGTVNTINDLYTWSGLQQFSEGDDVIVFVKNINATTDELSLTHKAFSGEIPYRGSFYKYMWETQNWLQVVLGNHSHSNMEILDQLGEINTASMEIGDKKMLVIEKINDDGNTSNLRKYEYKLSYEDLNELPDVPADARGKNVYLSADKDGKFQWTNSFVPAQTFKYVKINLSNPAETMNFTGHSSGSKTLTLSKEFLDSNDIVYNADLNDEILIFDSGDLITDFNIEYLEGNLKFTLTSDKDTDKFECGETIAILFIRNGIAGLIDTIENQYITKAEAASLMSNGTINLNSYITRDELKKYAAGINHAHKDYLRRDDYDAFDFRYADYHHTHSDYITKADVLAILTDACSEDGELDIDKTVQEMVTSLETYVQNVISNTYTKDQINNLIKTQVDAKSYTDAIVTSFDGRNLSDYLIYLTNKSNEVEEVSSDITKLESDKINLGEGETLGGYNNGDVIDKGTTLTKFIHTLITKEKVPEVHKPEIKVDYTVFNHDAGATSIVYIKPTYVQNNGGDLKELKMEIFNKEINEFTEPIETRDLTDASGEGFNLSLPMNACNSEHLCYIIRFSAEYYKGERILSNVMKEYTVQAGTTSTEIKIYNQRLAYVGAVQTNNINLITEEYIYESVYGADTNSLYEYLIDDEDLESGIRRIYDSEEAIQTLIFALPNECDYELNKIIFENQNFDMMDEFSYKDLTLYDASHSTINNINNSYRVYYYTFVKPIQSQITIQYKVVKKGE